MKQASVLCWFVCVSVCIGWNTAIMAVSDMSKGQSIIFMCIYLTNMTTENIFRETDCVKKDGA